MTASDRENIERKLNHVLDMGKRIIDLYPHITCTERVALLLAMTAAVRQTAANIRTVEALLQQNLLDSYGINYITYARQFEDLHKIWIEELKGAPMVHNLDNRSRPLTNPNEIAFKEDTDYDFTIRTTEEDDFNFLKSRVGLMENAPLMCEAVENGLEQIGKSLREIEDDYMNLKADTKLQDKRLKELEKQYEEMMWDDDKRRFVDEVKEYTEVSGDKKQSTFQRYLDRMDREATDPHDIKVLADLNNWFLEGARPAAFVVENRDKLTIENLARHFCFVRCRKLLSQHIERFDLRASADEAYDILFVNKAAQELAFLLKPTIAITVDFQYNYQFAALQMAMQDLGLVYSDKNNGLQMKIYINADYMPEDEKIKDQTTLTQWTGKLLGAKFGSMDENHLKGNYRLTDFEKLKDHYWLCLSIINKVLGYDLQEMQLAPYLHKEHDRTPTINDYKNREGQSLMERLFELKSVIRGESLFV